jgi:hypothetical protein
MKVYVIIWICACVLIEKFALHKVNNFILDNFLMMLTNPIIYITGKVNL